MDNTYKIKGLDLFSGIGGIGLALQNYVRTVAYCEIEPYCRAVLMSRMSTGHLDYAPIWDDIKSLDGRQFEGEIDIIFGGFPCQDISVAGAGKGLAGERSGLFFEILRLAKEIKPSFIFLENVPAITTRGGLQVVEEITSLGYDCRWCVISAASVGALHRRERWFLLAHAINDGTSTSKGGRGVGKCFTSREEQDQPKESIGEIKRTSELSPDVADANSMRKQQSEGDEQNEWGRFNVCCENDSNTDSQPSNQANSCTSSVSDIRKSWGDNATECWPFESRDDRQEIKCEFCGVFNGLSHKLDTNEIEGIDAKKTERRTCKILSNLQSDIEAKEIWKSFRRYEQIFSQKVLFSELYKDQHTKGFPIQTYNRSEIQEIQKKQLRILQLFREFMSSSCGWESLQQRPLELENALLFMSYNFASSTRGYCQKERKNCLYLLRKAISSSRIMSHAPCQIKEEWESFSEEEKDWHIMASIFGIWWSEWPGIERATSEKLDNLVDRLRSLGNSVVPQQVKKAFEILMGLYTKQGSDEP